MWKFYVAPTYNARWKLARNLYWSHLSSKIFARFEAKNVFKTATHEWNYDKSWHAGFCWRKAFTKTNFHWHMLMLMTRKNTNWENVFLSFFVSFRMFTLKNSSGQWTHLAKVIDNKLDINQSAQSMIKSHPRCFPCRIYNDIK